MPFLDIMEGPTPPSYTVGYNVKIKLHYRTTMAKHSKQAPVINAIQSLRGVALITAATVVAEAGDITRFQFAKQIMSYTGVVPSEYSSGPKQRQGAITKTGNSYLEG